MSTKALTLTPRKSPARPSGPSKRRPCSKVPLLEKNLVALSTIASIATMVGLLGTTIGMIRAFRALAHAGAPDAIQLSIGISEALINTAGGLAAAIIGIVFYNYFVTKVDNFTYMIDEASYTVMEILTGRFKR